MAGYTKLRSVVAVAYGTNITNFTNITLVAAVAVTYCNLSNYM